MSALTIDVALHDFRYLIKDQGFQINRPQPAFQLRGTMGHNTYHLLHKALIGCNLPIPALNQVLHNNGNNGIQLQVDIVAAGQGR